MTDRATESEPGADAEAEAEEVIRAERLARMAHRGQTEESTGEDYAHHLERVVALVKSEPAKSVAWLHDVMEDTGLVAWDLRQAGISEKVVEAVRVLTRGRESYKDYIHAIKKSGNPLAIEVKLADLMDHVRHNPDHPCPARLKPRYIEALRVLRGGDPAYQGQPCGCDPGAGYTCTQHQKGLDNR